MKKILRVFILLSADDEADAMLLSDVSVCIDILLSHRCHQTLMSSLCGLNVHQTYV